MNETKKDAILFVAEPRSTYDFGFYLSEAGDYTLALIDKILATSSLLGAETTIFASVSPVSRNQRSADFHFGHVKSSWDSQCFIEGWSDEDGDISKKENALMGKCFFPEGYAELSKEKGFGNYEIIMHEDSSHIAAKLSNYIEELSENYNIKQIFIFYDFGYSNSIVFDEGSIREKVNAPITYFIPSRPYNYRPDGITLSDDGQKCCVWSSSVSIAGVIDCFEQYQDNINYISSKMNPVDEGKAKSKNDDKKNG